MVSPNEILLTNKNKLLDLINKKFSFLVEDRKFYSKSNSSRISYLKANSSGMDSKKCNNFELNTYSYLIDNSKFCSETPSNLNSIENTIQATSKKKQKVYSLKSQPLRKSFLVRKNTIKNLIHD